MHSSLSLSLCCSRPQRLNNHHGATQCDEHFQRTMQGQDKTKRKTETLPIRTVPKNQGIVKKLPAPRKINGGRMPSCERRSSVLSIFAVPKNFGCLLREESELNTGTRTPETRRRNTNLPYITAYPACAVVSLATRCRRRGSGGRFGELCVAATTGLMAVSRKADAFAKSALWVKLQRSCRRCVLDDRVLGC